MKAIEQLNYSIYAYDPNDFLVNGMLELLDQYQRLEIALKLGRGRRKKAEQGGYAGGGIPFGYKVLKGNKLLIVDDHKAEIVRRLFELTTASTLDIVSICRSAEQGRLQNRARQKIH